MPQTLHRSTNHSIAIVGGGASGAALAVHLLRSGSPSLTVHIFESREQLGWGIAYGGAEAHHILNVPAGRMSLWASSPNDFMIWARRNGPGLGWPEAASVNSHTYLPRRLFGHYVEAKLQTETQRAKRLGGPTLIHHQQSVARIERDEQCFRLITNDGNAVTADSVVLALGFRSPAIPFAVEGEGPSFIADPWSPGAVAGINRTDTVLIAGTGLSMVDAVGTLASNGHSGHVYALSRHGFLPLIHGVSNENLPMLDVADAALGIIHCLRKFRHAIRNGQTDWRSGMDGLRPVIDDLWRAMSTDQQDRFLHHIKPFWEIHRHRMPAESAELLLKRISKGTLTIEAARVAGVRIFDDGVEVSLRPRGAMRLERRQVDKFIKCTPPAAPLGEHATGLFRTLLEDGLARPGRTGRGLDIEPDGTVRDAQGHPVKDLYALGPLRLGQSMETTAIPHIRPQLAALTSRLLRHKTHQ